MANKEQTESGFWEESQDAPSTKAKTPTYEYAKSEAYKKGDYATAGLHRTRKTPYKKTTKRGAK